MYSRASKKFLQQYEEQNSNLALGCHTTDQASLVAGKGLGGESKKAIKNSTQLKFEGGDGNYNIALCADSNKTAIGSRKKYAPSSIPVATAIKNGDRQPSIRVEPGRLGEKAKHEHLDNQYANEEKDRIFKNTESRGPGMYDVANHTGNGPSMMSLAPIGRMTDTIVTDGFKKTLPRPGAFKSKNIVKNPRMGGTNIPGFENTSNHLNTTNYNSSEQMKPSANRIYYPEFSIAGSKVPNNKPPRFGSTKNRDNLNSSNFASEQKDIINSSNLASEQKDIKMKASITSSSTAYSEPPKEQRPSAKENSRVDARSAQRRRKESKRILSIELDRCFSASSVLSQLPAASTVSNASVDEQCISHHQMNKFLSGFKRFQKNYFLDNNELYNNLKNGQHPKTLLIGCCDSRCDPAILTGCEPGDIFVVRDVANLVAPYNFNQHHYGVSAALEFAVKGLKVESIIVMGHTLCGGINALMSGVTDSDETEFIGPWMKVAQSAKDKVLKHFAHKTAEEQQRACEHASILLSLENLVSYPWIKERLMNESLTINGWYFDFEEGELWALNPATHQFEPLVDSTVIEEDDVILK